MEKRAQRIPSWPGVIHSNKGRIHLRRPTCGVLKFRLRRGGGPYIPITRLHGQVTYAMGTSENETSGPRSGIHVCVWHVTWPSQGRALSVADDMSGGGW